MINISLHIYQSVKTPVSYETETIENILSSIKYPNEKRKKLIEEIRSSSDVNIIKKNKESLPTTNWSSIFTSGYRKLDCVEKLTGIMYIDIDHIKEKNFDTNLLTNKHIFCYWHSVSNNGYGILVYCNNLTTDNYKKVYTYIVNDLNLTKYYDKACSDITRNNIISYDNNLYINENFISYDANNISYDDNNINLNNKNTSSLSIKKEEEVYRQKGSVFNRIKYSNINDVRQTIDFGETIYYTNWNGIDVIECSISVNKVKNGNRQSSLLSYCTNLVILNPTLTIIDTEKIMNKVNLVMCKNPVDEKRIKNIVTTIFKQKNENKLKPIIKKRKIIFDNITGYTKNDKLEICRELVAEKRTNDSKQKIYNIIEQWDFKKYKKISQSKICKIFKMSPKTLVKYWPEFYEYVNELNNNNMKYEEQTPSQVSNLITPENTGIINNEIINSNPTLNEVNKLEQNNITNKNMKNVELIKNKLFEMDKYYSNNIEIDKITTILNISKGFEKYSIDENDISKSNIINKLHFYWIISGQSHRIQ